MVTRRELGEALERVIETCDRTSRLRADPVGFVHRYADPLDREIVALVASSLAFGNVKTIHAKVGEALDRIGPAPHRAEEKALLAKLRGFKHRVFRGQDVARLVFGARCLQEEHGSLGARFAQDFRVADGDLRAAAQAFTSALRERGGLVKSKTRRGPSHLLPDAKGKSAMKRFLLFLRWMIRPNDGIDLGLWRGIPTSALVIPLDVHIHKLSRNLGLTKRDDAGWETAVEITRALSELDPADPVRFDFALCHMGMLQRCPSRRDPVRCEGCGVMPVCRHWTRPR
jgi:uncharacterized protein (TIGR02757 family)